MCASRNIRKPKNVGSSRCLACTQRLCCNIISFQILSFHVLPATHSSFLSSPVSLWPPLPSPLSHSPPPCFYCFLCVSRTPFSLFNSLFQSKYYLTSSQRLSSLFPLQPRSENPRPAVLSLLQRGEPLSCILSSRKSPLVLYACSGYSAVY